MFRFLLGLGIMIFAVLFAIAALVFFFTPDPVGKRPVRYTPALLLPATMFAVGMKMFSEGRATLSGQDDVRRERARQLRANSKANRRPARRRWEEDDEDDRPRQRKRPRGDDY
ncbi:hypothetical protein [Zavarzinella formosa]|uniref:hypothetical protein n=1 Tax=Zavarzinella formosa TaxID=360055 RepID=UPI000310D5EC|nr:hypothetical protein [Zavarzinella formosa]